MTTEPFDRADSAAPAGLGDRLDDLLLVAETWLAERRTVVVAGAIVVVAAAAAWFALWASASSAPVEESIPLADPDAVAAEAMIESTTVPGGGMPPTVPGEETSSAGPGPASGTGAGAGVEDQRIVVHVVGAVRRPGLVSLVDGDRISDAITAAGGGGPDADLERLNLASPLIDGMQIRVPTIDEATGEKGAGEGGDDGPAAAEPPLIQLPSTGGAGPGPGVDGQPPAGPVDLNQADETELQRLPGIGPALAARIVVWRSENGGFATVDELESVPGIGPAKLAGLRDLATV